LRSLLLIANVVVSTVLTMQAMVTIGSETSGSILGPSGANGIVGIKPTVGLVSREGVVPLSESQDTAG
jgi:amidase